MEGARAWRSERRGGGEERVEIARVGDVFRKNVGRNCATDSLQPFDLVARFHKYASVTRLGKENHSWRGGEGVVAMALLSFFFFWGGGGGGGGRSLMGIGEEECLFSRVML